MGTADDARTVYTPAQLAERWSCSAWTVRQCIGSGELEAFRVGSLLRVRAEAVAAYEARQAKRREGPTPEEREAERRRGRQIDVAHRVVMIVEGERRKRMGRA